MRGNGRWVAALVLAAGWAGPFVAEAHAGGHGCPPSAYTPWHYWAPTLFRVHAEHHGPAEPTYAPDRYPGLPPRFAISRFPCPAVDPAAFYGGPVSPPAPPTPAEGATPYGR